MKLPGPVPLACALLVATIAVAAPETEGHAVSAGHFLLVLAIALVAGRIGAIAAERIGQPAVLGELLAGVVVGASVLGRIAGIHVDPSDTTLHLLAEVGVVLLLFEIGLETDLQALLRAGPSSLLVAFIGVIVPFVLGFAAVHALASAGWLEVPPEMRNLLGIFAGATLTATSVGVTARVLQDLGQMASPEARILLGAAVIDDVLGLVILAVVGAVGLAASSGQALSGTETVRLVLVKLAVAAVFLLVAVVLGRWMAPRLFNHVDALRVRGALVIAAISVALLLAVAAERAGSALLIGGFAAGLALSGTNQFDQISAGMKPIVDLFAPLFFVTVGAAVDVAHFNILDPARRGPMLLAAVLLVVAVAGKLVAGAGVLDRKARRLTVGVGMVPRGEVGFIFARAGAQIRVPVEGRSVPLVTPDVFSALTLVIVATTFMAPPLLRTLFRKQAEQDE